MSLVFQLQSLYQVLSAVLLSGSLLLLLATNAEDAPFNVLLISIDDLRWNPDDPLAYTPNLDEFAADAVTFTHTFSQFAKCAPSRNSFLSGMRPDSIRCYTLSDDFRDDMVQKLGEKAVSLPQYFKDAGTHYTYGMGKIYHAPGSSCACPEMGQDWPWSWHELYKCFQEQGEEGRAKACSPRQYYQDNNNGQPWLCNDMDKSYFQASTGNGCLQTESCLQCLEDAGCMGDDVLVCGADCPDECFIDYLMMQDAITFIDDISTDNYPAATGFDSWFLGVGFLRPHTPFIGPLRFFEMYDIANDYASVPLATNRENPPNMNSRALGGSGCSEFCGYPLAEGKSSTQSLKDPDGRSYTSTTLDDSVHHAARGGYYATVTYIDDAFGRIITKLKDDNLYENTVIVVVSDHGFLLGELNMFAKSCQFDVANRAPLLIRVPGLDQTIYGKSSQLVVELLDIFPTLVEAVAGLDPNDPILYQLEGKSLMPIINSLADSSDVIFDSSKYFALSQIRESANLHSLALRTENWRYTAYTSFHHGNSAGGVVQDHAHPTWNRLGGQGLELYNFSNEVTIGPSVYNDYNAWDNYNYAYEDDPDIISVLDELEQQLLDNWHQTSLNLEWRASIFSNTDLDGTWQTLPSLPVKLTDVTCASTDKSGFYLIGGVLEDGTVNQVMYKFKLEDQSWSAITPTQSLAYHSGASKVAEVYTGEIFVFGGGTEEGSYFAEWTVNEDTGGEFVALFQVLLDEMYYSPIGACSGRVSSRMYIAGGYFGDYGEMDVLLDMNLVKKRRANFRSNLPNGGRAYSACGAYDGLFYVFGGRNNNSEATNDTIVYDRDADEWSQLTDMPVALYRSGKAAELNGKFIIVGGQESETVTSDKVLVYDPVADEWDILPNMMTARFGSSAISVINVVYSAGGRTDSTSDALDVHEALTITYSVTTTDPPTAQPTSIGVTESPSEIPSTEPTTIPTQSPTTMEPSDSPSSDPTPCPTRSPTDDPSESPSNQPTATSPTETPTLDPTQSPSSKPTAIPSAGPTKSPTMDPTQSPSDKPTSVPTNSPTMDPTESPSKEPTTSEPSESPSSIPTSDPSQSPSDKPTSVPTKSPTIDPTQTPSAEPTSTPTKSPTGEPTQDPSKSPTGDPTSTPTKSPTSDPTQDPSDEPTSIPTKSPTDEPSGSPSDKPTSTPTESPTSNPTSNPTLSPSEQPTSSPTVAEFEPLRVNCGKTSNTVIDGVTWLQDNNYIVLLPTKADNAVFTYVDTSLEVDSNGETGELHGSIRWFWSPGFWFEANLHDLDGFDLACDSVGTADLLVDLYFAETLLDAPGERVFDVLINGELSIEALDVYQQAGGKDKELIITRNVTFDQTACDDADSILKIFFNMDDSLRKFRPMVSAVKVQVVNNFDPPSLPPSESPSARPTMTPSRSPTSKPTTAPSKSPTNDPTNSPTNKPTDDPTKSPTSKPTDVPSSSPTRPPLPSFDSLRVNCGILYNIWINGKRWAGDEDYITVPPSNKGMWFFKIKPTEAVSTSGGTDRLHEAIRWFWSPGFWFNAPLHDLDGFDYVCDLIGSVNLQIDLYFAEAVVEGPNERIFDVYINGELSIEDLDVYTEAGGQMYKEVIITRNVALDSSACSDTNSTLELYFEMDESGEKQRPMVSAVEVQIV